MLQINIPKNIFCKILHTVRWNLKNSGSQMSCPFQNSPIGFVCSESGTERGVWGLLQHFNPKYRENIPTTCQLSQYSEFTTRWPFSVNLCTKRNGDIDGTLLLCTLKSERFLLLRQEPDISYVILTLIKPPSYQTFLP